MSTKDKTSLMAILNASKAIKYDPNFCSKYYYPNSSEAKIAGASPDASIGASTNGASD